jgi:hypothetical protein
MADPFASLVQKAGQLFGARQAEQPVAQNPQDEAITPKTADPYADTDAILALVQKRRDEWGTKAIREPFLRAAYRNILFYRSHQWLRWDRMGGRWRPAVIPKDVPTPVTNVFADTMDAVMSVFGRIEPQLNFSPGNPDEPEDRATADVATRVVSVIESEVSIRTNRQSLATWVGLTGGAFLETGYDPDPAHGLRPVEVDACPACGHTQAPGMPMCEGPDCGQVGPLQPMTQQLPVGKMFVKVRPLFEVYFDPSIPDFSKHRKLLTEEAISVEDAEARWPEFKGRLVPNVVGSAEEWYMASLATQGPALDDRSSGRRDQYSPALQNNRITERWYWQMPDETYPEGLLAIVVGQNSLVYAKALPYKKQSAHGGLQPFLPFTWFPQHVVPGTMWPKTVADDVALKQAQRNRWESAIELCAMRMGMPIWLVPNGANVKNFTGTAGQIVTYNAMGPANAKPERVAGQGLPLSFIQFIELIDKAIEKLAKTFDVIKGARPEGVSAGIALQVLQERGMSAYGRLFIQWETAWANWALQAVEIARQYWTEERILKIQGKDGAWQAQKFAAADLQGRVDVAAEAGSSMPRSTLLDRAEMEQLIAMGAVPDPRVDPESQQKVLEVFQRENMFPSMERDAKNAIMEDEVFAQIAQWEGWQQASDDDVTGLRLQPDYPSALAIMKEWSALRGAPMFPWPEVSAVIDGHPVHSREHKTFGKSESYRKWPKIVQAMFEMHLGYHSQLMIQQMAAVQGGGQIQGGFMQPAPGGAMPQQQPFNTTSGGARMAGEAGEMASDVVAGGM